MKKRLTVSQYGSVNLGISALNYVVVNAVAENHETNVTFTANGYWAYVYDSTGAMVRNVSLDFYISYFDSDAVIVET